MKINFKYKTVEPIGHGYLVQRSAILGPRPQSGAKATAVQTLTRRSGVSGPREASGLRRVHRRFSCAAGFFLAIVLTSVALNFSRAQEIRIENTINAFGQKPVPVALDGFTGEAAEVLKFDLFV